MAAGSYSPGRTPEVATPRPLCSPRGLQPGTQRFRSLGTSLAALSRPLESRHTIEVYDMGPYYMISRTIEAPTVRALGIDPKQHVSFYKDTQGMDPQCTETPPPALESFRCKVSSLGREDAFPTFRSSASAGLGGSKK